MTTEGLMVAIVTPFRGGALDLDGMARLLEFLLEGGTQGIVVSGSTGEAATCTLDERRTLWRFVRERVRGRAPVVAGTGSNNTADSIAVTKIAEEAGLDGVMLVTPYYNKPTPRGQVEHFTAVSRSTRLPVILYNVPGRTGTNTPVDVFERVQNVPNIVAVKEASGSLDHASAIRARTRLTLLSGDDSLTLPMMAVGATGVVSVVGNVAPAPMRALCDAARAGRLSEAEAIHRKLLPLFRALFIESNPGPAKFLLSAMGLISNELRLPLVPVEPESERAILAAATAAGVALETGAGSRSGAR
jgi:4-hydroxy-tetrahydrodipicolinate synthase